MAKASDLMGRSGSGGFGPQKKPAQAFPKPEEEEGKSEDHSATKQKPVKDSKPHKGGGGPSGGAPTSVRPKV